MDIGTILNNIVETSSSNKKKEILSLHKDNILLKKILKYAYDPFLNFNVVKVPSLTKKEIVFNEKEQWLAFFYVADACETRKVTGNAAINSLADVFTNISVENENWMRKILKKHLNIGISTTTINKIWEDLIPDFSVQLAEKFDDKGLAWLNKRNVTTVAVEPKLDGIRCIGIVKNGICTLYSRNGKPITNFVDTVGQELLQFGDGVFDGEIMSADFLAMMTQFRRKNSVNTTDVKYFVFDWLPLESWLAKKCDLTCQQRREKLEDMMINSKCGFVSLIHRDIVQLEDIKKMHDVFASQGYEGIMIKTLDAMYEFDRSHTVMKLKMLFDIDVNISGFYEGREGTKNQGTLGGIYIHTADRVRVGVGSGFSDELRNEMWLNKENFLGRLVEIRYQEVTEDGSLRFPTFRRFRNDK